MPSQRARHSREIANVQIDTHIATLLIQSPRRLVRVIATVAAVLAFSLLVPLSLHAQCPTAVPTQISPEQNSGVAANSAVTFSWSPASTSGVTGYDLMIGPTGGTAFTVGCSSTATQCTISSLPANTYDWYVRAKYGASCPALDSTKRVLYVGCLNAPVQSAPADNSTSVSTHPTFTWSDVGADAYDVYLGSSNGCVGTPIATVTGLSFSPPALQYATQYQWRVVAKKSSCANMTSSCAHFTTTSCPAIAVSPTALPNAVAGSAYNNSLAASGGSAPYSFTVVSGSLPSGLTLSNTGVLAGTPANGGSYAFTVKATDASGCSGATNVTLNVIASANCPSPASLIAPAADAALPAGAIAFSWTAVTNASAYRLFVGLNGATPTTVATSTSPSVSLTLAASQMVEWYVAAVVSGCSDAVSNHAKFTTTTASCPTAAPLLIAPSDAATNVASPVQFSWSAVNGATSYRLLLSINGAVAEIAASSTETTASRTLPDGAAVSWAVTAIYPGSCANVTSATRHFTVAPPRCPDASITLLAPAEGARISSPVTFNWTSVSAASSYRVWVAVDGGSPTLVAHATTTSATATLPSGAMTWSVEALRDSCDSVFSPVSHFTIASAATCDTNKSAALVAPIEGATVASSVAFSWTPVSGAIGYKLWIASNGQPAADSGTTTDTHATRDVSSGFASWYVETLFANCPSLRSSTARFIISKAATCGSVAPVPLGPANGATNVPSHVTFSWSAVANATSYRVYVQVGVADPLLAGETDGTSLARQIPPGQVTWSVVALFDGCPAIASAKSSFTIPAVSACGSATTLIAPAEGNVLTSQRVNLSWSTVPGATSYLVWGRVADGAPTPLAETVGTELEQRFPAGAAEWWVETFFDDCSSVKTPHSHFTVQPACNNTRPLLLSPVERATKLVSPVDFSWTAVPRATSYRLWMSNGDDPPNVIAGTTETHIRQAVPTGHIHWFVEVDFAGCDALYSERSTFTAIDAPACATPRKPAVTLVARAQSSSIYSVRWTALPNSTSYEVAESASSDFAVESTQIVNGTSAAFSHVVAGATPFFYRVRALSSCSDDRGQYSDVASIIIVPEAKSAAERAQTSVEIGTQRPVVQTIQLPASSSGLMFTATTDQPWLTVTPSTGTVGAEGTTLTVTGDASALPVGTAVGTVKIAYAGSAKRGGAAGDGATATSTIPISISLTTPVGATGKSGPIPASLIIPAVAHAGGANDSMFESDVRLTNVSAQTIKYMLNFTPSGTDGTVTGQSTTIEVEPGATAALDDILSNFFASGASSASTTGVLEIRPLTSSSTTSFAPVATTNIPTVAASRTYNVTPNGTFGQFIPAIPFSQFIGQSSGATKTVLSLQQIAQSDAYRTNFGLVEGAGEPATVVVHVFSKSGGAALADIPYTLLPGEHRQINSILAANGITLDDGRIEVEVTSPTGKVTAYASVIDNRTNDPLLVSPVVATKVSSNRYTVPGVADLSTGLANWRTDMRLFNAGAVPVDATLSFFAQGSTTPQFAHVTLLPGQVQPVDNVLQSLFSTSNAGGSVVVTTPATTSLVVTARTYNQTPDGTYGQFIPAVTPADAVGLGDRLLQILQLEQSDRFRTNIGLAESSGKPATAEISIVLPDSKVALKLSMPLQANEFRQIGLADLGITSAYNARVTVKVTAGTGRVTAYGSVIDQQTQDPTYVPAQ
jgi:hypothetical protein